MGTIVGASLGVSVGPLRFWGVLRSCLCATHVPTNGIARGCATVSVSSWIKVSFCAGKRRFASPMSSTLIFVAVVLLALVDVVLCTKLLHKGSSFRSFVASKASRFTGRSVKHKTEDLLEAGERQVREQVEDILMGRRLWYASAVNTCMAVTALSVQPVVVVMLGFVSGAVAVRF